MTDVISVVEHDAVEIVDRRKHGQRALSTRHEGILSRLEPRLPAGTFTWTRRGVRFGSRCGVLSLGDVTVEILPKIYGIEEDTGSSRRALVRMLAVARRLKLDDVGVAGVRFQAHSLLDVFVLHFCHVLNDQLLKGLHRQYREAEDGLVTIRGRIGLSKQLRSNLAVHGRTYCHFDEFDTDNPLNRIIRRVVLQLRRAPLGRAASEAVLDQFNALHDVSDVPITAADIDRLPLDRQTRRFESVLAMCRWFVENTHPDVTSGDSECVALLFDMNRLFEAFVASKLRAVANVVGMTLRAQGPRRYMVEYPRSDTSAFLMIPDLTFSADSGQVEALADTKWKVLDQADQKLAISQADLYQMESYATRYRCTRLLLIYPRQRNLTSPVEMRLLGSGSRLVVVPFDLMNPVFDTNLLSGHASSDATLRRYQLTAGVGRDVQR